MNDNSWSEEHANDSARLAATNRLGHERWFGRIAGFALRYAEIVEQDWANLVKNRAAVETSLYAP